MKKVSVLPINEWKQAQKKPSLVSTNDGVNEEMSNHNVYFITKSSHFQVLKKRGR